MSLDKNTNSKTRYLFFAVLACSFILRLITLDSYETWADEKISVSEANGILNYDFKRELVFTNSDVQNHNTLSNVILSTIKGDGGNGILYVTCLHFWSRVFGNSDASVRSLSLIFGLIVVVLIYRTVILISSDKRMALLIMALAAIHPQLISYSQEARAYMLGLVFTLLSTNVLILLVKSNMYSYKHICIYMFLVTAGFLSHYSTCYIFLSHLFIFVFIYKISLRNFLKLAGFLVIPLAILLVWFSYYGGDGLKVIAQRNQNYIQMSIADPENSFYMKTSFYYIVAGWFQNLFWFAGNTILNLGFRIAMVLPLIAIPLALLFFGLKRLEAKLGNHVKAIFVLLLSSLIYATVLSLVSGHIISFQQLYSIFSTPYFVILLGISIFLTWGVNEKRIKIIWRSMAVLQIAIMLFSTSTIYFGIDSKNEGANKYEFISQQIRLINSKSNEEFYIYYNESEIAMEMNKYLGGSLSEIKQIIHAADKEPAIALIFPKTNTKKVLLE